jgi:hypothetical protein
VVFDFTALFFAGLFALTLVLGADFEVVELFCGFVLSRPALAVIELSHASISASSDTRETVTPGVTPVTAEVATELADPATSAFGVDFFALLAAIEARSALKVDLHLMRLKLVTNWLREKTKPAKPAGFCALF